MDRSHPGHPLGRFGVDHPGQIAAAGEQPLEVVEADLVVGRRAGSVAVVLDGNGDDGGQLDAEGFQRRPQRGQVDIAGGTRPRPRAAAPPRISTPIAATRVRSLWRVRAASGSAEKGRPAARCSLAASVLSPPPIRVPARWTGRRFAVASRIRRPTIRVREGRTSLAQFSGASAGS
jgi:hypothetical protein